MPGSRFDDGHDGTATVSAPEGAGVLRLPTGSVVVRASRQSYTRLGPGGRALPSPLPDGRRIAAR